VPCEASEYGVKPHDSLSSGGPSPRRASGFHLVEQAGTGGPCDVLALQTLQDVQFVGDPGGGLLPSNYHERFVTEYYGAATRSTCFPP
jgi:hypothetical protein